MLSSKEMNFTFLFSHNLLAKTIIIEEGLVEGWKTICYNSHSWRGATRRERCTAFCEVRLRSFTICKQACIVLACTNFATTGDLSLQKLMQASEWKFTYISNERSLVSIKSVEYRVLRGPGGGSSNHSNGYSYIELTLNYEERREISLGKSRMEFQSNSILNFKIPPSP